MAMLHNIAAHDDRVSILPKAVGCDPRGGLTLPRDIDQAYTATFTHPLVLISGFGLVPG